MPLTDFGPAVPIMGMASRSIVAEGVVDVTAHDAWMDSAVAGMTKAVRLPRVASNTGRLRMVFVSFLAHPSASAAAFDRDLVLAFG
jgi:hypothetical protein